MERLKERDEVDEMISEYLDENPDADHAPSPEMLKWTFGFTDDDLQQEFESRIPNDPGKGTYFEPLPDEWATAKEAAQSLNITVRSFLEQYVPDMDESWIIPALKEYEYTYDFEEGVADWGKYLTKLRERESRKATGFKKCFDVDPRNFEEDFSAAAPMTASRFKADDERGFDKGVEARHRIKREISPALYWMPAVYQIKRSRWVMAQTTAPTPRGANGRFVKHG